MCTHACAYVWVGNLGTRKRTKSGGGPRYPLAVLGHMHTIMLPNIPNILPRIGTNVGRGTHTSIAQVCTHHMAQRNAVLIMRRRRRNRRNGLHLSRARAYSTTVGPPSAVAVAVVALRAPRPSAIT